MHKVRGRLFRCLMWAQYVIITIITIMILIIVKMLGVGRFETTS